MAYLCTAVEREHYDTEQEYLASNISLYKYMFCQIIVQFVLFLTESHERCQSKER